MSAEQARKPRKSRQKRNLGEDTIDSAHQAPKNRTSQNNTAKRKSTNESQAPIRLPMPDPPFQSSSDRLRMLADSITKTLVDEIKVELEEERLKMDAADPDFPCPQRQTTGTRRRSTRNVKPSARKKEADADDDIKDEMEEEESEMSRDESESPERNPPPPRSKNSRQSSKDVTNQSSSAKRLRGRPRNPTCENADQPKAHQQDDAVNATLDMIRADNAKKIMELRAKGKFSTGGQAIAQDAEITRFVQTSGLPLPAQPLAQIPVRPSPQTRTPIVVRKIPATATSPARMVVLSGGPIQARRLLQNKETANKPAETKRIPDLIPREEIVRKDIPMVTIKGTNPPPKRPASKNFASIDPPKPKMPKVEPVPLSTKGHFRVHNYMTHKKGKPGHGPIGIRTVTLMPTKNMFLNGHGLGPAPSATRASPSASALSPTSAPSSASASAPSPVSSPSPATASSSVTKPSSKPIAIMRPTTGIPDFAKKPITVIRGVSPKRRSTTKASSSVTYRNQDLNIDGTGPGPSSMGRQGRNGSCSTAPVNHPGNNKHFTGTKTPQEARMTSGSTRTGQPLKRIVVTSQPAESVSNKYTRVLPDPPPARHGTILKNKTIKSPVTKPKVPLVIRFGKPPQPISDADLVPPPGTVAVEQVRGKNNAHGYEFLPASKQPHRLFHPDQPQLFDPALIPKGKETNSGLREKEIKTETQSSAKNTLLEKEIKKEEPESEKNQTKEKVEASVQNGLLEKEVKQETGSPCEDEPGTETHFYDSDENVEEINMETMTLVQRSPPPAKNVQKQSQKTKSLKPTKTAERSEESDRPMTEPNDDAESSQPSRGTDWFYRNPSTTKKGQEPPKIKKPRKNRVYLGPEEPMKDLEEIRTRRYTITRVAKFTAAQLRPFGKRPPGMHNEMKHAGAKGLGIVLIPEIDEEAYEKEVAEKKAAEAEKWAKKAKLYADEKRRQEEALALKVNYLDSESSEEEDNNDLDAEGKPKEPVNEFRRIFNAKYPLELVPILSEKLSETNPTLYANLQRIQAMHNKSNMKTRSKANKPRARSDSGSSEDSGDIDAEEDKRDLLASERNKPTKMYKVQWNGRMSEVPSKISCPLCDDVMSLCMRKSYYFGQRREYPSYRCLRKGCQTFRSVKKVINDVGGSWANCESLNKTEESWRSYLLNPHTTDDLRRQQATRQLQQSGGTPSSSLSNGNKRPTGEPIDKNRPKAFPGYHYVNLPKNLSTEKDEKKDQLDEEKDHLDEEKTQLDDYVDQDGGGEYQWSESDPDEEVDDEEKEAVEHRSRSPSLDLMRRPKSFYSPEPIEDEPIDALVQEEPDAGDDDNDVGEAATGMDVTVKEEVMEPPISTVEKKVSDFLFDSERKPEFLLP